MPLLPPLLLAALVPLARPDSRLQYYYGPADKSVETWSAWWRDFTQATRWSTALDPSTKSCSMFTCVPQWRDEARAGLDLARYELKEVAWARTSFIQPQLMIHDRLVPKDVV